MRACVAVLGSVLIWITTFFATSTALTLAWPAYREHGRILRETGEYGFTPPMFAYLLACWMLSDFSLGFVCAKIGRNRRLWTIPAFLVVSYLAYAHYREWLKMPWWYNVAVVVVAVPLAYLGSASAARGATR